MLQPTGTMLHHNKHMVPKRPPVAPDVSTMPDFAELFDTECMADVTLLIKAESAELRSMPAHMLCLRALEYFRIQVGGPVLPCPVACKLCPDC